MLFSSITFLYYFLPCVILIYYLVPRCFKNIVLLLASFLFYAWGEPVYLLYMIFTILQGYILGILIDKYCNRPISRMFLALSIGISIALLGYFKYADFLIGNINNITKLSIPLLKISLPIGISFYTFQMMSYVIDVYRKKVPAQKNLINMGLYIAMFPQLIAGPIVRYSDIAGQLAERTHSVQKIAHGMQRFIVGLSKKVLIADILGELAGVYHQSDEKTVLFTWMYAIAFMLQIYFDFSGYSDMAIGLGSIFGFCLPENFRYPYIAKSITEFWRRWHISLGSWFRDYLYVPLGGNRVKKWKWFRNIIIVWMATGLWHGADWTFIVWGLLFGMLLVIEKLWLSEQLEDAVIWNHIYVLFWVMISFVIFDASDIGTAFATIGSLFGTNKLPFANGYTLYYLKSYAVILAIAVCGATPLAKRIVKHFEEYKTGRLVIPIVTPFVLVALLCVVTAFLIDGSFHPFLYFRF